MCQGLDQWGLYPGTGWDRMEQERAGALQDSPGRAREPGLILNVLLGPWVWVPGEAAHGH